MSSLVSALIRYLPPQSIQLASPVDRVQPLDEARWLLSIGGRHPGQQEVDGVILATPAHQAAKILKSLDVTLASQLATIDYASCAVVSLGYRRSQIKHPLAGFGFVVPLIEQRNIFSCSFASIKYEGRAPDGSVLLALTSAARAKMDCCDYPIASLSS